MGLAVGSTRRTNAATVKKPDHIDTELLIAKEEMGDARIENMGDTGTVTPGVRVRRMGEETGQGIQGMDIMNEMWKEATKTGAIVRTSTTTKATKEGISSVGSTESMANKAGTKALRPSKAAQSYGRYF